MRMLTLLLAILALSAFVGCQSKPMVVSESGSGQEGIKVHGDWTVEVTNSDGSLARKIQFSNYITEEGFGVLAALMTHDQPIFSRRIYFQFYPSTTDNSCNDAGENVWFPRAPKAVSVISADQKGSIWSAGCTVSLVDGTTTVEIYNIQGQVTLEADDAYGSWVSLSKKSLWPDYIEVVDGQYISATVVYSFN